MRVSHQRPPGPVPDSLPGFEHIKKYWDPHQGLYAAKILPGEFYVTNRPNEIVVTVLGSCVSACIRDERLGIGGMNHFMLPVEKSRTGASAGNAERYGNFAMESLINELISRGARRQTLEVKVTGGGRVLNMASDVGSENASFVLDYLVAEGMSVMAQDLGDVYPRKVYYYPMSGRLRVKKLTQVANETIRERETSYARRIQERPVAGDVELF